MLSALKRIERIALHAIEAAEISATATIAGNKKTAKLASVTLCSALYSRKTSAIDMLLGTV